MSKQTKSQITAIVPENQSVKPWTPECLFLLPNIADGEWTCEVDGVMITRTYKGGKLVSEGPCTRIEACAALAEETACGRDAEAIAEAIRGQAR